VATYRCVQFGNCACADSRRNLRFSSKKTAVCPECGETNLAKVRIRWPRWRPLFAGLSFLAAALLVLWAGLEGFRGDLAGRGWKSIPDSHREDILRDGSILYTYGRAYPSRPASWWDRAFALPSGESLRHQLQELLPDGVTVISLEPVHRMEGRSLGGIYQVTVSVSRPIHEVSVKAASIPSWVPGDAKELFGLLPLAPDLPPGHVYGKKIREVSPAVSRLSFEWKITKLERIRGAWCATRWFPFPLENRRWRK
jgi:hypothetical protein